MDAFFGRQKSAKKISQNVLKKAELLREFSSLRSFCTTEFTYGSPDGGWGTTHK